MKLAILIATLVVAGTLERPALTGASGSGAPRVEVRSAPLPAARPGFAPALAPVSAAVVENRPLVLGGGARLTTIRRLQRGPLAHHAYRIEAAAWRYRVSPFAIVAISGVESSYGRFPCRSNPRNIWGLGACGRAWKPPYFATWKQAYHYYARFLRRTWPKARTVYDLRGYCECGGWAAKVASLMRAHYGKGPGVGYP